MINMALWFGTLGGRLTVAGMAVLVFIGFVSSQRHVGVQKERARVEKQGQKVDAKAQRARAAAEQRPADSLRSYLRD